ncbi:metallophosphoesterase [Flavobacterium soyangense]|uniref:Metallophosphoesterase n=1 Tax=Flavobacterium soyangense TaxID=2023265 RepID=A0A930XWQ8_9FLAO|nr:metallophosphoesterase [Flavobacterium soyangense]MBF2709442.1 metallophosphoesterase [Flavobacterium soyangense]
MRYFFRILLVGLMIFLSHSCATFDKQTTKKSSVKDDNLGVNIYLIGDAGLLENGNQSKALDALKDKIKDSKKEDVLLFLGDNVYPKGMPSEISDVNREEAENSLQAQTNIAQNFKGKVIFIPGNHDWYSGIDGLKEEQKMVEKALGKNSFLPKNGCPIDSYEISKDIVVIAVDSEWYLTDWDKHPKINDNCNIKTRFKFFEEFKSLVNKNQGKTIVLAMHHPLESNGNHGGQYAFNILKTPLNIIRRTSGASPEDSNYPLYRELSNKITTILQEYKDNVIVVSGHDHNLQYLVHKNISQIISGSGSKVNSVRHFKKDTLTFGYSGLGYSILNIQANKQAVSFFDANNNLLHSKVIREIKKKVSTQNVNFPIEKNISASIYNQNIGKKSSAFNFFFGNHYRELYSKKFNFQVVNLDTLYGGLKPVKLGGGNQSVSLRLEDKDGKEYVMRRLRKSATQFIQVKAFQQDYMKDRLNNTVAERFLMDFYTTSYPFSALVTGNLSDIVGVYHANPQIFYIPKQNGLENFNDVLGNDLYLIEERLSKEFKAGKSFGKSDDIVSTDEVMNNLMKDEKYNINHQQYIKTRLFDMWLGDWDRHEDQYRWATYINQDGTISYAPIPRDRDQAFPKFDGFFTQASTHLVPALWLMQSFGPNLKNVETFNQIIYKTDMMLINQSSLDEWLTEASFLQKNLTDESIEKAFANLPEEIKEKNIENIKANLKSRRDHIADWANEYYKILNKNAIIIGTNKDDIFEITRLENGSTHIKVERNKSSENSKDIVYEKEFYPNITKEIWIYGLDDKDHFIVNGNGKAAIKIIIVGGQDKDIYTIENPGKIQIYDYKTKESVFEGKEVKHTLTDDYTINTFDHNKFKHNFRQILPSISYNPDDGFLLGALMHVTKFNFENNPFSQKHTFGARYLTATNGFEVSYKTELANSIKKYNIGFETRYTTPAFSQNFFGFGNETKNFENSLDIEYYRTRLEQFNAKLSLIRRGKAGSLLNVSIPFDYVKPNDNMGRIIEQLFVPQQLEAKKFIGFETNYRFENKNNKAFSTLGFEFNFTAGWKTNLEQGNLNYAYFSPALQIDYPIIRNEKLTLSTLWKGNIISNNNFEFYQAASIGGKNGLRGYRNERFSGKSSYYQNTDLRMNLFNFNAGILPAKFGVFSGFDYGKVWLDDDNSNKWHTSYGGGIFANAAGLFIFQTSYFASDDGGRFVFGLDFGF